MYQDEEVDCESHGKRFVLLIVGKKSWFYDTLRVTMNKTWIKNDSRVYYVYGNGSLGSGSKEVTALYDLEVVNSKNNHNLFPVLKQERNTLICDSRNGWEELLPNTISAMKYLQENVDFDFLIRTNQSTYWNLDVLSQVIENLPLKSYYGGFLERVGDLSFISGSGMFLSKDVVGAIVANQKELNSNIVDDVEIGRYLRSIRVLAQHISRPGVSIDYRKLRFCVQSDTSRRYTGFSFGDEVISASSIRCKSLVLLKWNLKFKKLRFRLRLDVFTVIAVHAAIAMNGMRKSIGKRLN